MKLKIKVIFAWYDCWIGFFYDRHRKWLYFFPLPMIGLRFQWQSERDRRIEVLYG